jgi:hypothetical protein
MYGASPPRPIYLWHIFMYRSNCSILSGSVCRVGEYRSENGVTLFFCILRSYKHCVVPEKAFNIPDVCSLESQNVRPSEMVFISVIACMMPPGSK